MATVGVKGLILLHSRRHSQHTDKNVKRILMTFLSSLYCCSGTRYYC